MCAVELTISAIYTLTKTEVVNSRRLSRRNEVWRRRRNDAGVVFTTRESVDTSQIRVTKQSGKEAFNQGALFLSIYKACDHLEDADQAAWHLSETVVQKLLPVLESDTTTPAQIAQITQETLKKFDKLGAAKYASYRD